MEHYLLPFQSASPQATYIALYPPLDFVPRSSDNLLINAFAAITRSIQGTFQVSCTLAGLSATSDPSAPLADHPADGAPEYDTWKRSCLECYDSLPTLQS